MTEIKPETVRNAENAVRDVKNWLATFKTEYSIAEEACTKLSEKIDAVAEKIGAIVCLPEGIDKDSTQSASDALAELRQWLATFKTEYSIADEAVNVLNEQLSTVGEKLALIECK